MSRDVENARSSDLFERRLGGAFPPEQRRFWQYGFDRQSFALRPRQRREKDPGRITSRPSRAGRPGAGGRVDGIPRSLRGGSRRPAEERIGQYQGGALARLRVAQPQQVTPTRQVADGVALDQISIPFVYQGGKRDEVERAVRRDQQTAYLSRLRL